MSGLQKRLWPLSLFRLFLLRVVRYETPAPSSFKKWRVKVFVKTYLQNKHHLSFIITTIKIYNNTNLTNEVKLFWNIKWHYHIFNQWRCLGTSQRYSIKQICCERAIVKTRKRANWPVFPLFCVTACMWAGSAPRHTFFGGFVGV